MSDVPPVPGLYPPGNHGVLLYTYAKLPRNEQNASGALALSLGSYVELPRNLSGAAVSANTGAGAVVEDEDDYYFTNSLTSTGAYGTKTATGNSRIFNCKHCQRAFTREEHLTRHILLTHNKLKPYVCGICTRPFSRRDLLLRHAKNLHDGLEMAVLRIRKLYKKLEKGDPEPEGTELQHGDSQRMKMSVNMLVS